MSDDATAGGAAAGEQENIADTTAEMTAEMPNEGVGGNLADLAGDDVKVTSPADWPDDWRERIAGKDEKELARLKRFASVENLHKSYRQLEKRLSETKAAPTLPENATEEQVAEYRRAIGVPETPDGYDIKFAPEVGADAAMNAALQSYLAFAHERNIPPAAARAAVEWQQAELLRQRDEQTAASSRERARISAELRREYGADMKRNLGLADEWLDAHPGIKKHMRGDDMEFVRDVVKLALDSAPEDALYEGADSGGRSLDEQIEELTQKAIRGTLTKSEDTKYNRLLGAKAQRDERRQGRAA